MGAQAPVKYHYFRSFLLTWLGGSGLPAHLLDFKALSAGSKFLVTVKLARPIYKHSSWRLICTIYRCLRFLIYKSCIIKSGRDLAIIGEPNTRVYNSSTTWQTDYNSHCVIWHFHVQPLQNMFSIFPSAILFVYTSNADGQVWCHIGILLYNKLYDTSKCNSKGSATWL